jgi:hypothetical protein
MILDLNPLPYRRAMELVRWCYEHNIDKEQCVKLINGVTVSPPPPDLEWMLDIPDKHLTFFMLKWSGQGL